MLTPNPDGAAPTLQEVLALARALSPYERVQLVQAVMATLERELAPNTPSPKRALQGLWPQVHISSDDIDRARREMWRGFPAEGEI